MRIEELVLEGFKSYPGRTQISGWDASFNAITGLNGSGKSNILDAIAFVLGLQTMSTMRAQHQSDLVYKKGQAGITKASVTIVFDNSDKATSPPGYDDWKQITVTRQFSLPNTSKFLVNGHRSTQQQVLTLFQSVQLNINNPNFVIMQGKITKVLNMRAAEILGMVEEASGTRMYEERKDKARKTMDKKEKRLDDLKSTLTEEIMPKLDKLRAEKSAYLEFQKAETEKENLEQVLTAWRWYSADNTISESELEIENCKQEIKEKEKEKEKKKETADVAQKNVDRVTKDRERESKKGGKLSKLKEDVKERDMALEKTKTQVEMKKKDIKDEEGGIATAEEEVRKVDGLYAEKEQEAQEVIKAYDTIKAENTVLQDKLKSDEELLQTLLTGLSSKNANSGGGGGYMGQLQAARTKHAQAISEEEQLKKRLAMHQSDLKTTETQWKKVEHDGREGKKRLELMQGVVAEWQRKLAECAWNEQMQNEGEEKILNLQGEVHGLSNKYEQVKQRLGNMTFDFTTPGPYFNRNDVKGRLGKLITLRSENFNYATALEVTAGGRLLNVVVANEKIGKDLLERGELKSRVTLIPLNKISPSKVAPQKLSAVAREDGAQIALDLIEYEQYLAGAMSFTFGSTVVCETPDIAKRVTFDRTMGLRSVTVDGDVYEPGGTLSGGAKLSSEQILVKVQELIEVENRLRTAKARLAEAEAAWNDDKTKRKREQWERLKNELDMKAHELQLAEDQVGESNATRLKNQVDELKRKIEELGEEILAAQKRQEEATAECEKLERDMEEFKSNKDGKIDELKQSITSQKAVVQKKSVKVKTKQKDAQAAELELEQLRGDKEAAQSQIEDIRAAIVKLKNELVQLERQKAAQEDGFRSAKAKLEAEESSLRQFDEDIKNFQEAIKKANTEFEQAKEDIVRCKQTIDACRKAAAQAEEAKTNEERLHPDIIAEHEQFGQPGTKYDFNALDVDGLHQKAAELEEAIRAKRKKVNAKSANMLDDVEKRETALKKMLSTVVKDKEKIEETIATLDKEKRATLQSTFEKVDKDFGQIFAELLPGNFAKLVPPQGMDLMDGLEVKVQLGSVWKQSLTELSGGQRSLIALSLIMALLQFKPAPMYILDEIDAALDLQHTQNIGQLFRTRFKGSQFIVVSLKEGLFTNANVLFRTRFRDGTSIVERTASRSTSS